MHFPRLAALLASGGFVFVAGTAHADVEVGAFAGLHTFSVNNELGVPDVQGPPGIDATSLRNSVNFGLRGSYGLGSLLAVEGEVGLIPTEARNEVSDAWVLAWRGNLLAEFGRDKGKKLIPFVLAGAGALSVVKSANTNNISDDTDEEAHVGVGFKYRADNDWLLRVDLRAIFPPSSENKFAAFDSEILIGVSKDFGKKKAAPAPEPVVGDTDGDGLKDDVDKCPNDPEDKDNFQDDDGCPDPDNDGDGVADKVDQCPNDPEDVDGYKDDDGCPDPDNDGDGIADAQDKCPNDAEDKDGFQDDDGCPDPDNDGDGIPDTSDQCPADPETVNGYKDDDGCPDTVPVAVKQFTGVIKGITFKNDSDVILKTSNKTLDAAVKVLKDYPDLTIEIQGHTDDTGSADHNQDLSQRRADAVKKYMVDHGVDAGRLTAVGYGNSQPLVNAKTKAARSKNRRVEFKLGGGAATPPTTTPNVPASQSSTTPASQP